MRDSASHPHIAALGPECLIRLAALATALLLLVFGPASLLGTESDETAAAYIVQGKSVERVSELIAEVGGEVTHELEIIRAVGARLTDGQRDTLAEHPEITRIWRDRQAEVQSDRG